MPERLVDDECELRALAVEDPTERLVSTSFNDCWYYIFICRSLEKSTIYTEEVVETSTGNVLVAHSGDRFECLSKM